jgi:formate hydrogenlyase transcriptional activator
VRVDVRVIAATNQDLESAMSANRFRADLYYRLSVFPIRIPALRERREDIPLLARYFVRRAAEKLRRPATEISHRALQRLVQYDWPGNVRELQNVMERAVILTADTIVDDAAVALNAAASDAAAGRPVSRSGTLADTERQAILSALDRTNWRISGAGGAAETLGLKSTTLHAKMKKLGIRRPAIRARA